MKTILASALATIGLSASALAEDVTITIPGPLPNADICEQVWSEAQAPEDAVVVFVAALLTYEFNAEVSRDCMERIVHDGYLNSNGELSRDFEYLMEVGLADDPQIPRSYVRGATPENGYALPDGG